MPHNNEYTEYDQMEQDKQPNRRSCSQRLSAICHQLKGNIGRTELRWPQTCDKVILHNKSLKSKCGTARRTGIGIEEEEEERVQHKKRAVYQKLC
eukprot:2756049-Amphidinium_carterae.1